MNTITIVLIVGGIVVVVAIIVGVYIASQRA